MFATLSIWHCNVSPLRAMQYRIFWLLPSQWQYSIIALSRLVMSRVVPIRTLETKAGGHKHCNYSWKDGEWYNYHIIHSNRLNWCYLYNKSYQPCSGMSAGVTLAQCSCEVQFVHGNN